MDASEMCVGTSVLVNIIWWVRAGSWTSAQHVIVGRAARQLVLCRCVREIPSAKTSSSTTASVVLNAGMRMVGISVIACKHFLPFYVHSQMWMFTCSSVWTNFMETFKFSMFFLSSIKRFIGTVRAFPWSLKGKLKSHTGVKQFTPPALIPGFCSMKQLWTLLPPHPEWDATP